MFRKRKPAKQLSADELKSKLYAHFDKTGSLNQMKTEIRGKLVTELFKMRSLNPSGAQSSSGFEKILLPLQVCNWLVYDHLLRQGYQYALSTFVAEASVSHPEQLLTAADILGLFGLDSTSSEYKSISRMYSVNNEQDSLHSLLLAVVKSLLDFHSKEEKQNKDVRRGSVDGDLFDGVNASENSKFAEKSFVTVKSRDTSFEEQLQVLKEEKEKEIQALRQKWLQELDRLHSQERSMREEVDLKKREIQRQLDEVFAEKEKLKEKEYFLIKEHENKLEKKTRELESEYLSKIHSVENELKISQGKLYDKELRIAQVETDSATVQTNNQSLKRELEEIKQTYKATKEKYSSLLDENTKLLRKFESMSDYSILKGDLEARSDEASALQQELEKLKMSSGKEREGALEKIKNVEAKLKHKETLLAESQRQLSNCRETMQREEAIWHRERRKLESDSLESKEMYKNLIKRIENQSDDIQALHQTIHILHYQLTYSDKKNEPKSNSSSKKRGVIPPVINRMEPGIFRINNSSKDTSTYTKDSLKFIEEAKGRIKNLEKEANALRHKYSPVFSTVPSLENIQDKNDISPLIYNITNIPNFPIKSQSPLDYNFETLIRNEIPTLDPCLQMSRKTFTGSDQVLEKDAKVYSTADNLKHAEMQRGMTPSFSGLSSLNIQQQNFASEISKDIVDSSVIENEKASSLNADQGKTSNFKQHSDDRSPALVKRKLGLESNEGRSRVENELTNPSTALQYQTVENNMSDSMLGNLSKPSDMPGIGSNTSSNVHSKYKFDLGKQPEKIPHLKSSISNSKGDGLDIGLPLKEDSSLKQDNSICHDSDLSFKDDSGSRFDSGDIGSVNSAAPKPVGVDLDSAWKRQSLKDSHTPKPDPPVVDLDSAWKRKSSLKDNSENPSVPSFFSSIDSVWRRKSVMSPIHSKASSLSSTPKKTAERKYSSEKEVSEMTQVKEKDDLLSSAVDNSRNSLEYTEHSHPNPTETKKNDLAQSSDSNNACSQSIRDTEPEPKTELSSTHGVQPNVSNPNLTERRIEDDSKKNLIEEKAAIPDEHTLEVLSSEASDVHLSCGSEQEQGHSMPNHPEKDENVTHRLRFS